MNNKRILLKYKKLYFNLRFVMYIFGFVLFLQLLFLLYVFLFRGNRILYFDGVNALDYNNSFYVTVGSNNDNSKHYEKAKLSKYDKKYNKIYDKLYNIGFNSAFFDVSFDEDNIVAVGSYEKTSNDHVNFIRHALIVKYDSYGNVVFEKDFKVLDNSKFTSIYVVDDGYLVTGQSVYCNNKIGTDDGGALLVKYDKDGNLLWKQVYGNNKTAIYNDLLVVDNYIFTVGLDNTHISVICKYDMDGNFITYNDYKYTDDIGFSGIVNIDGNLFVSGSNGEDKNMTNAMIVKYDFDCEYLDEAVYKNKGTIRFSRLMKDINNNIIVIGVLASKKQKNNTTSDVFNYDGIVGKYDSSLKEISVITYGDERDDYFTDIQSVDNDYLVVGYSSYEDGSYLSKFICYSDALKVLKVE